MDNELNAVSDLPENISSLSIAELRTALSVRGLSVKGSKKALISRLVKHLEQLQSVTQPGPQYSSPDFSNMNESNDNLSAGNFISELDKKRRKERSIRFKIGDVMNDILEMSELPDKQIEVQNRITELNELKEQYTCLNNEIIDLLPDDQVEIECQSFALYYKEIRNISD